MGFYGVTDWLLDPDPLGGVAKNDTRNSEPTHPGMKSPGKGHQFPTQSQVHVF